MVSNIGNRKVVANIVTVIVMDNNVKKLRLSKGLTQQQLGNLVNVQKGYISRIESGEIGLTQEWIRKFCDVLECTPNELLDVGADLRGQHYKLPDRMPFHKHADAIFIAQEVLKKHGITDRDEIKHLAERMCTVANLIGTNIVTPALAEWLLSIEKEGDEEITPNHNEKSK